MDMCDERIWGKTLAGSSASVIIMVRLLMSGSVHNKTWLGRTCIYYHDHSKSQYSSIESRRSIMQLANYTFFFSFQSCTIFRSRSLFAGQQDALSSALPRASYKLVGIARHP